MPLKAIPVKIESGQDRSLLRLQPDLNHAAAALVGVLHRLTSNAGSFVAGSQADPAAVGVGDEAR
jgi:hypothetical protein